MSIDWGIQVTRKYLDDHLFDTPYKQDDVLFDTFVMWIIILFSFQNHYGTLTGGHCKCNTYMYIHTYIHAELITFKHSVLMHKEVSIYVVNMHIYTLP